MLADGGRPLSAQADRGDGTSCRRRRHLTPLACMIIVLFYACWLMVGDLSPPRRIEVTARVMPTKEASHTTSVYDNRFVLCMLADGGRPLSAEADRGDGSRHADEGGISHR
jgi:hypothetical protein